MAEKERRPLDGRTILITRPRSQAEEMIRLIEQMGGSAVICSTIEVVAPRSWLAADSTIDKLETYDWIIFTSANSPRFFFRRLAEKRSDWREAIAGKTIFAIGSATAASVEASEVAVDLIASDSRAEGAVQAIVEMMGGEQNLSGLSFLIPRAKIARDVLPSELTRLGAKVDAVEVYETIKAQTDAAVISGLIGQQKVDAITFTSPSTVSSFADLVGLDDLSILLSRVVVGCIGPVTSEAAARFNLTNVVQPDQYNAKALIEAIAQKLSRG